jgi:hypothetical protein
MLRAVPFPLKFRHPPEATTMAFDKLIEQLAADMARQVATEFEKRVESELELRIPAILGRLNGTERKGPASAAKAANGTNKPGPKSRKSPPAGQKRDMRCRVVGCHNKSKGPRFGYFCEKHYSLPDAEKEKAKAEFAANNGK